MGVGTNLVLEQDQCPRGQIRRQRLTVQLGRGGQQQHPAALFGLLGDAVGELGMRVAQEELGCAQVHRHRAGTEVACATGETVERGSGPLAGRGERHGRGDLPGRWFVEHLGHRQLRGVRVRIRSTDGAEQLRRGHPVRSGPSRRRQVDGVGHHDAPRGDGAGLVQTERVDPCQQLHRCQLAQDRVAAGERHHAGHERKAGQQHQTVGHLATDAATTPDSASRQPSPVSSSRQKSTAATGGINSMRNFRIRLIPCRSSEPTSVNRRASSARLAAEDFPPILTAGTHRTSSDEAAREHLGAHRLVLRIGLAGQERLVQLEAPRVDHDPVDDHLGAGGHTSTSSATTDPPPALFLSSRAPRHVAW